MKNIKGEERNASKEILKVLVRTGIISEPEKRRGLAAKSVIY